MLTYFNLDFISFYHVHTATTTLCSAEGLFQKRYPHVTFVHANTNDILANNNNNNSTTNIKLQNSTPLKTTQKEQSAVKNFQEIFCGANIKTTPSSDSNGYVIENTLPQNCEMPWGFCR